jgi:NodT family efflux transporter outer membrane factor (OMF) lipoprotein
MEMRLHSFYRSFIAVAALALAACTVGPKYVRPSAPVPVAFKETETWKIAQPKDAKLQPGWWNLFGDPVLAALEEQVVISNQNIAAAEAQFRQATALVKEARAGYFPTATLGASVQRSQRGGGSTGSTTSTGVGTTTQTTPGSATTVTTGRGGGSGSSAVTAYSLPFELSWDADIWGRIRRSVEANRENAEASQADLAAATLSAQVQLAQDYFLLRAQDAQQKLMDETVASYQRALQLTRNRYAGGVAAKSDVLQAESQLKSAQAQAIDLGVQRAQLEHAIALLIGKPASSFTLPPAPMVQSFPDIPAGLPSQLLERRPDIAAAERRMAAANAQIGVAEAAFYPDVRLTASGGFEALSLASWFSWPSRFWAVGSAVSETLFDGGLRRAQTEQARAAYDAAVANYRQSVLTAFQEVEDNLAALELLDQEARAQQEAVAASRETLAVALNQYKAGIVSYLNVIVLQTTALANERAIVSIQGRRLTAGVLLIRALGGGWDSSSLQKL